MKRKITGRGGTHPESMMSRDSSSIDAGQEILHKIHSLIEVCIVRTSTVLTKIKKKEKKEYLPTQEPQSAAPGDPSGLSK